MTRIVFVTGHEFGCKALQGITESEEFQSGAIQVPLVVGLSESLAGSTVGYCSPRALAAQFKAEYIEVTDGTLRSIKRSLEEAAMDLLLVIGWSRLIPADILNIPSAKVCGSYGAIGMHPTLLPRGRGRAPIPWTIIKSLRRTGLSVFGLEEGPDEGAIVKQYSFEISKDETSASLYSKFLRLHYVAGSELTKIVSQGDIRARKQNEAEATYWQKRVPDDSKIPYDTTFKEAEAIVRGQQSPYPRARLYIDGDWKPVSRLLPDDSSPLLEDEIRVRFVDRAAKAVLSFR